MMKGTFGRLMRGGQGGDENPANLDTPGGRLTALWREIDSTATARRLTVAVGDSHKLVLDLANKKILKFVEMVPDDGRGKVAAEMVRDYDRLDFQLQLLAELFTGFVVIHGHFDLVSRPAVVTYPPKMDGFPTSELRFACDRVGYPVDAVAPPIAEEVAEAAVALPVAAPVVAELMKALLEGAY